MDTTIQGKSSTYHIIKPLKSGGMGEVLLARDDMDRRVAIKRPFASAAADGLARFEVEAQASSLDHPNIAKIYETGIQTDGRPYLAMEYVEGRELKEIIESGETLDLLEKLKIIEQVCSGLGYAHQKGFIHRDIKPANVMVRPDHVAKIIDFGIAKKTDVDRTSNLTQTSQVIGSLHYIAPERFKNEAMDGRVDVFSTGVMLYLLLTGKLPFSGGELTASHQIVYEAPTALGAYIKDYPPALDGIMDQALAKNPDQRFSTAEDFGDALHEVIEDLKKSRVFRLVDDAERLMMETRYEPALELLNEAQKLDPPNTQVLKLRRMVRVKRDEQKNALRLEGYLARAEEFLAVENYTDALAQLKEGYRVVPASQELKDRIALVEAQKQRYDRSVTALAEAEAAKNRGDITGAFRISDEAVKQDPDNTKLLALRAAIAGQLEREAQQARVDAILQAARVELSAKNFEKVEQLLLQAEAIDRSHPRTEEMRREMVQTRDREKRLQLLEEVRRHVNELLRADDYEGATRLLTRALDQLPGEAMLHRLKMEVDTAARKFDSIRFVDRALASAQQTFPTDPQKSLVILREALQQLPGDERLIACELSLRQQADALRTKQLLSQSLRGARDFLTAEQFDKAIDVLETYQLEHGNQADIDDLLSLSRRELAAQQRRMLVDQTVAEARVLVGRERLEDAVQLLEFTLQLPAIRELGDRTLSVLLDDVREKQSAAARKRDAVLKRAATHRERGEFDEGIQLLSEYLATGVRNPKAEDLLSSLQTDRARKQVTSQAIAAAEQATQQANFTAALDSLQAVVQAYGDSEELTRVTQRVEQARSAHAQQVVAKSIETSRAALLANDVTSAVAALREAGEMVEFADATKQADWKRIGQAAAAAQSKTGTRKTKIVDPLAQLPEQAPARKALMLGGAVCAGLVVVGFLVFHKSPQPHQPPPPPPPQTDAQITVRAHPGDFISINGGSKQATDVTGSLKLTEKPGTYTFEVTKEGYNPYTESLPVAVGSNTVDIPPLTAQPKNPGTLVMQGNLPEFKVTVDTISRGMQKRDGLLSLEKGPHTIVYSNMDGSDTKEHHVVIEAGQRFPDSFALNPPKGPSPPPPPTTGDLFVVTTPNALVSVDGGKYQGKADLLSGKLTVPSLPPGDHTVDISLDNYQPIHGQQLTITSGQTTPLNQPLSPNPAPPTTGSLSIQTTPGAQISLSGPGAPLNGTADGSGVADFPALAPGKYAVAIKKNGFQEKSLDITIRAGQPLNQGLTLDAKVDPPPPPPPPPVDHTEDLKGIKAAVLSLQAAYKAKNLGAIPAAWSNKGKLKDLFDLSNIPPQIQESNCSEPDIQGSTAKQKCTESTKFLKDQTGAAVPVTLMFTKSGSAWTLTNKISQ